MSANRSNARCKEHSVSTCRTPVLRLRFEQLEDRCLLAGAPELLKDVFAGSGGSSISGFVEVGTVAYFSAFDNTHGTELWKSDGTAAGTSLVKDIIPGSIGSSPLQLTNVNGTLFFTAVAPNRGFELWKSDGTESGTVLVKDIRPGAGHSTPGSLTNVNGTLFFRANDGASGSELWKSDGTAAGTVRLRDINPVASDLINEADERFNVSLSNASADAIITTAVAVGVIRDDDTSLDIAAPSTPQFEGNTTNVAFIFTITRSGFLRGATTVNYSVSGFGSNKATAGDFVGNAFPSGQVTFAAGETTKLITILVRGDLMVEPDEGFVVTLNTPIGASINTSVAIGLIRNDDSGVID